MARSANNAVYNDARLCIKNPGATFSRDVWASRVVRPTGTEKVNFCPKKRIKN